MGVLGWAPVTPSNPTTTPTLVTTRPWALKSQADPAESKSQTTCLSSIWFRSPPPLSSTCPTSQGGGLSCPHSSRVHASPQVSAHWVSPSHTGGLTLPCDNPNPTCPSSLHRKLFCPFQNTFISPSSETLLPLEPVWDFFFFNLFNYHLLWHLYKNSSCQLDFEIL